MKKKATLLTTLTLIGLVVLGTSCHKSDAPAAAPPAGAQKGGAPMLSAEGFVVKPIKRNNKIVSSGRLAANELVSIQPEVNGKITEILFSEGATVSKGALLIKLSDTDLQAQVLKVNTQRQLAVTTEQRQKKLLDINGISRQEYDLTTTQIKGFDADLEILKAQLEKTEIRAPFSGVMGLRNVSLGAVVSPATVISTLQQVNPLKLEFSVPEKYLPQLKVGQKIRCSFAGLPDTLTGAIYVMNPTIDAVTGTILAKAKIDNPKNKLSPGQFANVEVVLDSNPAAMVIPPQSVIPGTRFKQVAVYKNGEVMMKQVVTGDRTESEVEILQGLAFGDTILTTGIMQARDKAKVKLSGAVNKSEK